MLKNRPLSRLLSKGSLLAMLCVLGAGWAQAGTWVWLDNNGRKVFSDAPPPSSVPDTRILQQPGKPKVSITATEKPEPTPTSAAKSSAAPSSNGKPAATSTDPATLKKQQDAEAERKAQEEKRAQVRTENCRRARSSLATLESGVRLVTTNEQGERVIYDDAMRAQEKASLQAAIEENCN